MQERPASDQIDGIIALHGGWKGETLSQIRAVIRASDPEVVEEVKWRMPSRPEGLPVWYHGKMMCLAETFKNDIKLVFVKGAAMKDLQKFFNARLDSSTDRAIEFREGDKVDKAILAAIMHEAVRLNSLAGK